ncbi:MAG: Smr/MutS family protein, partial [Rhodospirillales bacterium]
MAQDHSRVSRRRALTREEEALFDAAMAGTVPLPGRRRPKPPAPPPEPEAAPAAPSSHRPPRRPVPSVRPALPELSVGQAAGIDAKTVDRLRRGRLRPEARLDLHGCTLDDAHRILDAFVARAQSGGRRCILVITGHGAWREGGGALKREVPRWLN